MDTQQINATFKKREFVLIYDENPSYPQYIKFEVIQEKCSDLDNFKVDDTVDVSFNLKGRRWINPKGEEVYFNTLDAWRITPISSSTDTTSTNSNSQTPVSNPDSYSEFVESGDDLPF